MNAKCAACPFTANCSGCPRGDNCDESNCPKNPDKKVEGDTKNEE